MYHHNSDISATRRTAAAPRAIPAIAPDPIDFCPVADSITTLEDGDRDVETVDLSVFLVLDDNSDDSGVDVGLDAEVDGEVDSARVTEDDDWVEDECCCDGVAVDRAIVLSAVNLRLELEVVVGDREVVGGV